MFLSKETVTIAYLIAQWDQQREIKWKDRNERSDACWETKPSSIHMTTRSSERWGTLQIWQLHYNRVQFSCYLGVFYSSSGQVKMLSLAFTDNSNNTTIQHYLIINNYTLFIWLFYTTLPDSSCKLWISCLLYSHHQPKPPFYNFYAKLCTFVKGSFAPITYNISQKM